MAQRTASIQTIRAVGPMLPADILQRIAALQVEGVAADDYHLAPGSKVSEAIAAAWTALQAHWKSFSAARQQLAEGEAGASLTNERWLLPLFKELDYGRLATSRAPVFDERTYPIERFYQHVPIHFVGCGLSLETRVRGQRGAAAASPHTLVQEYLNRDDGALWGFVSNGLTLRLLRDNASLSRPAFVEFDLQAMFEGEAYADFALLWLVCHQSRVEAEKPHDCWLEKWSKLAKQTGTRVLELLRKGVAEAIQHLGQGFLRHPRNDHLREQLRAGKLAAADFYRELLRTVYRLLFLFVAEDRELLHPRDTAAPARALYSQHYSTRRLRSLARNLRGSRHGDLWHGLSLVFDALSSPSGSPELALPALGSFLWKRSAAPHLLGPAPKFAEPVADPVFLANDDLLAAVRSLATVEQDRVLREVDYRNLGSEELGSVYESLLEMHPDIHAEGSAFELRVAAGNERKTTGSYYTPDSLVQCLLDSALEPVVAERLAAARDAASGEWRIVPEPLRVEFMRYVRQRLSPTAGVATGTTTRSSSVQTDGDFPPRGTVRNDFSTSPGGSVDSREHRRGVGTPLPGGVYPISSQGEWEPDRTGDAPDSQRRLQPLPGGSRPSAAGADDHPRQATAHAGAQPPAKQTLNVSGHVAPASGELAAPLAADQDASSFESAWRETPFAIRHSLFAEEALLSLRVCDPACGSGHFLIAAAHRLARHLARIRTGESEPGPVEYQRALRHVIARCIYGVDINPMAVELCKVSLWIESLEPGKPLSFLDHHIQCGNSLLGTTPALLAQGIPNEAFTAIEGDDKAVVRELRRENQRERREHAQGQGYLFDPFLHLGNLAADFYQLAASAEETLADVEALEQQYAELVHGAGYQYGQLLADTWCAAFVWKKVPAPDPASGEPSLGPLCPTERVFRKVESHAAAGLLPHVRAEVERLRDQYQFFHWHLAFPDVFQIPPSPVLGEGRGEGQDEQPANEPTGWTGGFDVVLGNPPWERVKLQEKEWFAERSAEIANAPNAAARKRLIDALRTGNPELHAQFLDAARQAEGESFLLRQSGRYPLCGRGDINVYTVFAETMRQILQPAGRAGCVLPSGIATDDTTKFFFQDVVETRSLVSLFDFENREGLFPAVDSRMKFCLFTAGSGLRPACEQATFVFFAHQTEHVADPDRRFTLSPEDIGLLNPNTRTCPIFRSRRDAELTKAIYRRVPVLIREAQGDRPEENPWGIKFSTMFHMSNDSHLFRTRDQLEADGWTLEGNVFRKRRMVNGESRMEEYLPLYEGRMIHHFDHRACSVVKSVHGVMRTAASEDTTSGEHADPAFAVMPRYWVCREHVESAIAPFSDSLGYVAFKDVTSSTNERTFIQAVIPRVAAGHKTPLILPHGDGHTSFQFLSVVASVVCDAVCRQKLGGVSLTFFVLKQLPVLPPTTFSQPCPWSGSAASDHSPFATHHSPCSLSAFLLPRVLELTYTAWDLEPFARDCGYIGPPFRWDEERRFRLRAELDAAFFHLYLPAEANGEWGVANGEVDEQGNPLAIRHPLLAAFPTPRHAVDYIMDTFPIVKRKDEQAHGEYRTKRVILEIYDAMQEATRTGQPYLTRLDPPPGPPFGVDGGYIPVAEWSVSRWPSHIHPIRRESEEMNG